MTTPFEQAVERELKGVESESVGLCSGCAVCLHDFDCSYKEIDNGTVCDEGSFSWHSCDGCGSILGGNRYVAHGIIPKMNNELIHLEVCQDCLHYLANGDVPENWEG